MKDFKISRELLSEVLKIEVVKHSLFNKRTNSFNVTYMQSEDSLKADWMLVNIYEFVFKCKEWAWKNFKILLISQYTGQCYINGDLSDLKLPYWENTKSFQVESFTEIEGIIKACEWIIKERI